MESESDSITQSLSKGNLVPSPLFRAQGLLSNQLKTLLLKTRGDAFGLFDELNIKNIDYAFKSNEYTWATHIECELKFKDVWVNEYDNGELINSYSLNIQII